MCKLFFFFFFFFAGILYKVTVHTRSIICHLCKGRQLLWIPALGRPSSEGRHSHFHRVVYLESVFIPQKGLFTCLKCMFHVLYFSLWGVTYKMKPVALKMNLFFNVSSIKTQNGMWINRILSESKYALMRYMRKGPISIVQAMRSWSNQGLLSMSIVHHENTPI